MPLTGPIPEGRTFFCPHCGALYSVTYSRLSKSDSNIAATLRAELSRGAERSSPRQYFPDCTIAMRGYDFREGEVVGFGEVALAQKRPHKEGAADRGGPTTFAQSPV